MTCRKTPPSLAARLSFSSASRFICNFHLRVLLEHLGVTLSQELGHPLVGHAAGAQPCCVDGPQVVDPEVGDPGPPERGRPRRFKGDLVFTLALVTRKQMGDPYANVQAVYDLVIANL